MADHKVAFPDFICFDCGEAFGRVPINQCATMHLGTCDICDVEDVPVTQPRDFGGLHDTWRNAKEMW